MRDELQQVPGNERLLTLQSSITGHISERSLELSRAEYLTQAHEALSGGRYLEALRLLESCQKEGIASPEIAELMDFARQEADQHLKTSQLRGLLRQAQELMTHGSYPAVIDLLTPVANDPSAASLLFLLEDARGRVQAQQRDIDAALRTVAALSNQESYAEAVEFLQSQPPAVLSAASVQLALKRWRAAKESEEAALQAVGKAYATLDRLERGPGTLPGTSGSESALLARVVPVFTSRRKSAADRQLASAVAQAQIAIEAGDRKQAALTLKSAKTFVDYAATYLQEEWQALLKKTDKGKIFGRRA